MNICVLIPNKDVYSETFIRAHLDRLPGQVTSLYGWLFPVYFANGQSMVSQPGFWGCVKRSLLHRLFGLSFNEDVLKRQAFKEYLKNNSVDVVLAEFGPTGTGVMDICQEEGVPLVVHFHGADAYEYDTLKRFGEQYRKMFDKAVALIAVSRHMEKQLLDLGAPKEKICYSPCGMDPAVFHGADPAKTPPVFLTVGRFVDKKAPHLVLLSFCQVLSKAPQSRLVMVGDGPLWNSCVSLAKALKIEGSVDFVGVRSQAEIAGLMRTARALVQHSIVPASGDSEGTPVVIQEAGGAGLPVISTHHGGIPDVVVDGVTGFLVSEGDVDAVTERMVRLAADPELAANMGRAAQKRVLENFTLDKNVDRLTRIIEGAVRQNPSGDHP